MYGGTELYGGVLTGWNGYLHGVPSPDVIGIPTVTAPAQLRLISERAPLRLSMNITTPDGHQTRWATAETNPLKTHQGLTFSTTLPGGFEHCDVTLTRDPRRYFSDLQQLEQITIYGVGGSIAWQGRLETIPSVSGDQLALSPGAVGYQSALTDDNSARELYVENDLTKWQGPSLNRQIFIAQGATVYDVEAGGTVAANPADPVNPYVPALIMQFAGSWPRQHNGEAWYDAQGVPIAYITYQAMVAKINTIGDKTPLPGNFGLYVSLNQDDAFATAAITSAGPPPVYTWTADTAGVQYDQSAQILNSSTLGWSGRVPASGNASNRFYAAIVLLVTGAGGTDGVQYQVFFRQVTLVGPQNLTLYNSDVGEATNHATVQGVLGSDVLKHAIPKYAPEIAITNQGLSTIQTSSFVIPELVQLNPGTVADIIKTVSSYELNDWAVWEGSNGPTFYWAPRNSMGRRWRSRMGPAKLQSTGPQIDRLFNGVIVSFTDFSGLPRTVGPGGTGVPSWAQSGCTYTDPSLIDLDPANPINQWGEHIRKWAPLSMTSTSTVPQAIVIGAAFLYEQRQRNSSGSAQISGYIEDDSGVIWPAWMIRADDQISFIDAADASYRRIISTNYNDETRINSLTLDSPPDSLQAILSRLQVTLVPISGG